MQQFKTFPQLNVLLFPGERPVLIISSFVSYLRETF